MIVVSIGRTRHKMAMAEHRAIAERGGRIVELRIDWLSKAPDVGRLIADRPTPVIITARRPQDKGMWKWPEDARLTALRSAIVAGVEYVDLEDDIARTIPRYGKTKRIISYHNFDETPENLEEIHARLCKLDADVVKIVTMAKSHFDNIRMLQLVSRSKTPTAGFCMGDLGLLTRVLCCRYGSPFTYCTFNADRELAPGQMTFQEMTKVYRVDDINAETGVYAVLGDPIGQSLSPILHNAAFRAAGLNNVYLPIRIPPDTFENSLKQLEWIPVKGYSVTLPHKTTAAAYSLNFEGPVRDIGAANTLYRGSDGQWWSANTDYTAIHDCLTLGVRNADPIAGAGPSPLAGKKVLILGAGGVARAAIAVCKDVQASVMVANRTNKRGKELAEEFAIQHITWENRGAPFADILVNCTSTGMHPNIDESPFKENWLRESQVVFDTVYNPENTLFIKQAKERGCTTVTGVEMFVRQAARQFELFTGQSCDQELMREHLKRATAAVKVS
jgi:3-dehydroquinate dehydratase/shikimate dehydrogenase